jgi:hypothetical protein
MKTASFGKLLCKEKVFGEQNKGETLGAPKSRAPAGTDCFYSIAATKRVPRWGTRGLKSRQFSNG